MLTTYDYRIKGPNHINVRISVCFDRILYLFEVEQRAEVYPTFSL